MSTQVAIRRGNTAQTAAFTGVVAELTVDTDKKIVVVHDGTTAGGNPLIKANASITTGQILTSNGSHLLALSNTGTAGTYGNASFIPVVTTDAYGRVSSVTNTAIAISSGVVTGVMTFAQGGANATSYTTGGLLTSNGTAFVSVANTGTAGTYANAAYIPVITTDAYGRVSAVTNTAIAIDTAAITSGTLADARLPATGTAGTYANATHVPVITTDSKGRVTAVTNTAISFPVTSVAGVTGAVSNTQLLNGLLTVDGAGSGLDADKLDGLESASFANAAFANTDFTTISATAGVYGNASHVPVTTLTANGRVSLITNTAIAIDTAAITSGTIADARLPTKGTAGVYGNAAYHPVITTDAYGRVTAVTNTLVQLSASQVSGGTLTGDLSITGNLVVSGTQTIVNTSTVSTNDSLLKLAANNVVGDVLDIGFYGQSNTGTSIAYHGLVRQAAGNFFLFKGIPTDPSTNTLATGSATAANTATLRANLIGGTVSSLASAIGIADGGTNQTTFTNGVVAFNGTSLATLANTGTAGTYGNAAFHPVITTDAYGRVSAVTNTAIAIDTAAITSGTLADARLPTKGTAGVYGNAAYHPVITTDAYGRVTAVTNTLVQIAASQVTSGVLPFAQGGANATTYTTGTFLTSNGTAFVSVANTGTAGTYANAAHVPVITTDAYGRVSAVTNTAIAIDTAAIASGTLADARLPATGTAGTYANASHIPVITTDSKGRVTAVTNTAVAISAAAVTSGTLVVARGGTGVTTSTGSGAVVLGTDPTITLPVINNIKKGFSTTATAAGTTTLTVNSNHYQRFTGSTTQTVVLPVTSTLVAGMVYEIENASTGNLTVNSSGGNLVVTIIPGVTVQCMCIGTTLTTEADWDPEYNEFASITGTGAVVLNTNPVLITPNIGTPSFATLTNATSLPIVGGTTGTLTIARGGTNQTTFTNGIVAFNGTALATLANTGTAGTYANATHVPVITTDAYGRVTAVTNTAISFPVTSVGGQTGAVSNTQLLNSILSVDGVGSGLDADLLDGFPHTAFANASFANTRFSSTGGSITGDVTVTGNLTIVGQTVYANTTTALIADNIITLNAAIGQASAPTVNAGIEVDRGSSANVLLQWNETTDKWQFTNDGSTYFDIADAGRLDSAFSLANGTAGVANTDFTTISTTAGVYGNAAFHPVVTLAANGRVSSITNTAIAIDTGAITSGTLADARLPTKGTAGTYGNTTYVPVITTDAYGRVTAVTNTAIQSGTTSVSGIVQLTDSISSTSTTTAATPNSVKTAYDYAQSAFTKANQTAQLAFTTVSANGTSLAADANNDTLTITAASANGIFINADAGTDALDIGLRNSGVTPGTYGNTTTAVTITVDAFGRITSVSNAAISGGATLGDVLALSIALG